MRTFIIEKDGNRRELNLPGKTEQFKLGYVEVHNRGFLTIKDLSDTLKGEEAKPKDIFYLE